MPLEKVRNSLPIYSFLGSDEHFTMGVLLACATLSKMKIFWSIGGIIAGKDNRGNLEKSSVRSFLNYFFSFLNGPPVTISINTTTLKCLFFLVGDGGFMIEYYGAKGTSSKSPLYYNPADEHFVKDPSYFILFEVRDCE